MRGTGTVGDVYAWGSGDLAQLGTGKDCDEKQPTKLAGQQLSLVPRRAVQAAAGSQHSIVLCRRL